MTDTTAKQADWIASKVNYEVKHVLDMGFNHGTSTIWWLQRFPNAKVRSIDNVPIPQDIEQVQKLAGDRFEFIEGDTQFVVDEIPTIFDFIYIDTAHDRLTTFRELVAAWSKLKQGGVLAGHDYHYKGDSCRPNWPGDVKTAVDEFCKYMGVRFETDVVDDPTTGVFVIYKDYGKDGAIRATKSSMFLKPTDTPSKFH